MKKKLAKVRKPRPGKARRAAAAAPPRVPPEPCRGGDVLSIDAMLRAQLEATHLAALACLGRATAAESPELRDRALTHATRLLSLFTRQVNALERGRGPAAAARAVMGARGGIAAAVEQRLAAAVEKRLAEAARQTPADGPADGAADLAASRHGAGGDPARQNGIAGAAPSGP